MVKVSFCKFVGLQLFRFVHMKLKFPVFVVSLREMRHFFANDKRSHAPAIGLSKPAGTRHCHCWLLPVHQNKPVLLVSSLQHNADQRTTAPFPEIKMNMNPIQDEIWIQAFVMPANLKLWNYIRLYQHNKQKLSIIPSK